MLDKAGDLKNINGTPFTVSLKQPAYLSWSRSIYFKRLLLKSYSNNLIVRYIDCSKVNCSNEIHQLVDNLGGLDLLVFSAGIGHLNKDLGYTVENDANKVNVLGFTEVVDWSYRYFLEQGSGHLVALSSFAGLFGFRTSPAYTAAKGYQINYLEALRQKAYRSKLPIYVTDIRPGFVDTEISRELKRFWVITPQRAANQIFLPKVGVVTDPYIARCFLVMS